MIEVGSGIESAGDGVNLLLRVGFGLRHTAGSREPGDALGPEQLIWAHMNADFGVSFGDEAHHLPYMDIRFTTVENQLAVVSESGNSVMGNLQGLLAHIKRDVNLDEAVTVSVALVGIQFGVTHIETSKIALYAKVAADALGYKMASHVSGLGTFHGVHVVTLGGEAGIAIHDVFQSLKDFNIRIAVGGNADLNLGGDHGGGFSVQSDMQAYLAVRADITSWFQIFIQAGMNGAWDSGNGSWNGSPMIMAGATFIF